MHREKDQQDDSSTRLTVHFPHQGSHLFLLVASVASLLTSHPMFVVVNFDVNPMNLKRDWTLRRTSWHKHPRAVLSPSVSMATALLFVHDSTEPPSDRYQTIPPTIHFRNHTDDFVPTTDGIPLFGKDCVPMMEWQLAYHPTCNSFHNLDYPSMQLVGEGGARIVWKPHDQDVALKTTKYKYMVPTRRLCETWRVDIMISERLTASKHVIDVYGHCGISSLNQIATTDPHWYKHHDQTSADKFALGLQLAHAVADLHSVDGDGNVTAVWLNAKPENILFVNGTLKITDFDESMLQRWDTKKQEACKFRLPTLTDPARKRYQPVELAIDGGPLDEKIDIYALRCILYSL